MHVTRFFFTRCCEVLQGFFRILLEFSGLLGSSKLLLGVVSSICKLEQGLAYEFYEV